jgi:hypothetical protein
VGGFIDTNGASAAEMGAAAAAAGRSAGRESAALALRERERLFATVAELEQQKVRLTG